RRDPRGWRARGSFGQGLPDRTRGGLSDRGATHRIGAVHVPRVRFDDAAFVFARSRTVQSARPRRQKIGGSRRDLRRLHSTACRANDADLAMEGALVFSLGIGMFPWGLVGVARRDGSEICCRRSAWLGAITRGADPNRLGTR